MLTGNILSFDFGERRVGVAIGNNITNNIHPLETIEASKKIDRYSKIESLLETWKPTQLIVGYPLNDDGSQSRMSSLAKKFGEKLKNKFNIPVHFVDERFTLIRSRAQIKGIRKKFKEKKTYH